MPILSCYVDDRTLAILQRISPDKGMTVEQLAEAAIENAALDEDRGYVGDAHAQVPLALSGDRLGGQPFDLEDRLGEPLMGLDPRVKREHQAGCDRHRVRYGMGTHDDPELGRESSIRPGFYEGNME